MSKDNTRTKAVPTTEYSFNSQPTDTDSKPPVEIAAENFGQSFGEEIGRAIGDAIREDPQARQVAVGAVGVGIGIGLLSLLAES